MLHYQTYNHPSSQTWVTFIHGAGGSSSIWFRQIRAFSKKYNVLMIDLRGHGKSKSIEYKHMMKYTFQSIGDDVMEVLDHLHIKATHLIGISLGTIIIRELTDRFPYRSASMIMGGAIMKLNFKAQFLMYFGKAVQSFIPYLWLYRLFAFIIMPRARHQESRALFVEEAKKLKQGEFSRWFTLVAEVNPLLRRLRGIDPGVATLYLMGAEDYMFLASIKKLVAKHPSSQLQIVDESGHVVNIDQYEEFNARAIAFIDEIESV